MIRGIPTLPILAILPLLISCTGGGPPGPAQEISFPDQGVTLRLADGWQAEVIGPDWSLWQRVQKGRADDPWVMPPITATDIATGAPGPGDRLMNWRLKGVRGNFDPSVNPLTSAYPSPPGLWILDPQKLDLLETRTRTLEWPGVAGTQATTRLYENTHGAGGTSAIWHTYTVTFNVGPNAYEFVMSLPDYVDHRDWIDRFWASIEDLSIEPQ